MDCTAVAQISDHGCLLAVSTHPGARGRIKTMWGEGHWLEKGSEIQEPSVLSPGFPNAFGEKMLE
jgi:hypothetical protein